MRKIPEKKERFASEGVLWSGFGRAVTLSLFLFFGWLAGKSHVYIYIQHDCIGLGSFQFFAAKGQIPWNSALA